MAVQAVVDEQPRAVLQRRQVGHALGRELVERHAAAGSMRAGKAGPARGRRPRRNRFIMLVVLRRSDQWAWKVTRSGTGLKVPIRLHQGISRKNPK